MAISICDPTVRSCGHALAMTLCSTAECSKLSASRAADTLCSGADLLPRKLDSDNDSQLCTTLAVLLNIDSLQQSIEQPYSLV
jgi:hypothetical protein